MIFTTTTALGAEVELTEEGFAQLKRKHEEVEGVTTDDIEQTLSKPDFISADKSDPEVFLYHKLLTETLYGPKICAVVVKHLRGRGFIITIYLSSKIKKGRIVWTRK